MDVQSNVKPIGGCLPPLSSHSRSNGYRTGQRVTLFEEHARSLLLPQPLVEAIWQWLLTLSPKTKSAQLWAILVSSPNSSEAFPALPCFTTVLQLLWIWSSQSSAYHSVIFNCLPATQYATLLTREWWGWKASLNPYRSIIYASLGDYAVVPKLSEKRSSCACSLVNLMNDHLRQLGQQTIKQFTAEWINYIGRVALSFAVFLQVDVK